MTTSAQWWRARRDDPRIRAALERQRRIAEARDKGATFPEIGRRFGVSAKRARTLYTKALKHERIERATQ